MKNILLVHNYYRRPGGEDQVFKYEGRLLKEHGHNVFEYTLNSDDMLKYSKLKITLKAIWNSTTYKEIRSLIKLNNINIVHFHNIVPLVSPSAYYAVKKEGATVVQTIHNYRYGCPYARFFRDGKICEDCLGKFYSWPGVLHACYQDSHLATAAISAVFSIHKLIGTWNNKIDRFIALTDFAKEKLIEGGYDSDKIDVKPNFILDIPKMGTGKENTAVFVGRISKEKGIDVLLDAWESSDDMPVLKIIGAGPLLDHVIQRVKNIPNVEILGRKNSDEVLDIMRDAAFLVVPSLWYEGFPMTIVEAFSVGLPVICSNVGGMAEAVEHNVTGKHFAIGNSYDLAVKVKEFMNDTNKARSFMRKSAREVYLSRYNAETNYKMLIDIYKRASKEK